jgi:predicted protein tyrosine phosphatase
MTTARLNVLFVCSHNQWRSPTAERVWRNTPGLNVRFAGTSRRARRALRHDDIAWADVILVIEEKHKSRGLAEYRQTASAKEIHVLDIPDNFQFMDPELVEILREKCAPFFFDSWRAALIRSPTPGSPPTPVPASSASS